MLNHLAKSIANLRTHVYSCLHLNAPTKHLRNTKESRAHKDRPGENRRWRFTSGGARVAAEHAHHRTEPSQLVERARHGLFFAMTFEIR